MTKEIVDILDRNKIKYVLDKNFLVEAGAGSGKTTSLVERMVQLIFSGTYHIHEIVAITFTRKAANELKNRFQSQLEKAWKSELNEEAKVRLEAALQNIEQCFLGTVHAFCAKLLRERPVEAGLDLTFQELEDVDDFLLVNEAWETYLQRVKSEDSSKLEKIKQLGIDIEQLRKSFRDMTDYPDVEWVSVPKEKCKVQKTYHQFIALLREATFGFPEKEPEKGYDDLQKAIIFSLRKEKYYPRLLDYQMIETFELFSKKSLKATQYKWKTKEDAKECEARIKVFFEEHLKQLLQAWKEYCHPIVIDFLKPAFKQYQQLKQERSSLNFQDLLMKTAELLKFNPEVRHYFQTKYRCFLVDEFQDTDPIQAEIMFYLTSVDRDENWQECVPRAGSLFVVGDPKQAIYRFRRADVDTYNRVKALIVAHGGEVLHLTMNFRTVDKVTAQLNEIFKEQLPEMETTFQAAYRPLNSFKEDDGKTFSGIKKLVIPGENKEEIVENDATMIAKVIQNMLKEGHSAKEFMVLTRYNDGIDIFTRVLQDHGITVNVSGEIVIGETKEFQELLYLLNVFVDPTNPVPYVSALRSSFFGISDEELYQWKQAGGVFTFNSLIPENLKSQTKEKFEDVTNRLKKYQSWVRNDSPTVAIEKIAEDIGFYALLLANGYGRREYLRFVQTLEFARMEEEKGNSTFPTILSLLNEVIMSKTAAANLENDENAVRIMNVHKAKGLEASIVFLAHPYKKVDQTTFLSQHIKREEYTSKGYFMFSKSNGYGLKEVATPPEWENHKAEEFAYLQAEEIRILYVAATRAEKAMIISCCEGKNTKNPWELFLKGIKDLEEIEVPPDEESVMTKEKDVAEITLGQFNQDIAMLTDWKEKSQTPSYGKYSPTDGKEEIFTLGIEREEGGGKNWGTLVHEIFEKLVKGVEIAQEIKQVLRKYDVSLEREEEIWNFIRHFQSTSIWESLTHADIVLAEVPFTVKIDAKDPFYHFLQKGDEQHPFLVTGIIDLVYKHDGKWLIIDYKTDRPKDVHDLPKLTEYYQDQVLFYVHAWEKLTNEKVDKAYLYFVTFNELVKLA